MPFLILVGFFHSLYKSCNKRTLSFLVMIFIESTEHSKCPPLSGRAPHFDPWREITMEGSKKLHERKGQSRDLSWGVRRICNLRREGGGYVQNGPMQIKRPERTRGTYDDDGRLISLLGYAHYQLMNHKNWLIIFNKTPYASKITLFSYKPLSQ